MELLVVLIDKIAANGAAVVGFAAFLIAVFLGGKKLIEVMEYQNKVISENTKVIEATVQTISAAASMMKTVSEQFSGHDERSRQIVSDLGNLKTQLLEMHLSCKTFVNKDDLVRVHDRIDVMHKDVAQILGRSEK